MAERVIDWEAIEREYRTSQLSSKEIGRIYGVSHTAIGKRAKKYGWRRDLSERVRAEASARLADPEYQTANEQRAVEDAASRVVEIVREHRHDIRTGRMLVARMMSELDATTSHQGALEAEILAATGNEPNDRRQAAMLKAISLPSRAAVMRDLSTAMKNLVGLERQAFSMDDAPKQTKTLDEFLDSIGTD